MGAAETCPPGVLPRAGHLAGLPGPSQPWSDPRRAVIGWPAGLAQDRSLAGPLSRRHGARRARGLSNSFSRANSCSAPSVWFLSHAGVAPFLLTPAGAAHCTLVLCLGLGVFPRGRNCGRRGRSFVQTHPPLPSPKVLRPPRDTVEFC